MLTISNNITEMINDLKYVCSFAEGYHNNYDQFKASENEENNCIAYLKNKDKFKKWGIILPISAVVAFILLINLLIVCMEEAIWAWSSEWWAMPGIIFSIFSLMGAVVMLSFGIYMFVRGMILSPKKERQLKEAIDNKEYYRNEFERYKTSETFASERNLYITYFPDCKAKREDIEYLVYVIETGRATNFKEALILLDEKKHKEEMQMIAEKTMEYAKIAAEKPSNTNTTVNNYYYR